jgi:hypothetical protein
VVVQTEDSMSIGVKLRFHETESITRDEIFQREGLHYLKLIQFFSRRKTTSVARYATPL